MTPDTHRTGILADSEWPICTGLLESPTLQICHLGNLNTSCGFLGQAAAVTSQRAHVTGSEAHDRKFGTGEIGGKAGTRMSEKGGSLQAEGDKRGPEAPGLCPIPPLPRHCCLPCPPCASWCPQVQYPQGSQCCCRKVVVSVQPCTILTLSGSYPSPATAVAQPCLLAVPPQLLSPALVHSHINFLFLHLSPRPLLKGALAS